MVHNKPTAGELTFQSMTTYNNDSQSLTSSHHTVPAADNPTPQFHCVQVISKAATLLLFAFIAALTCSNHSAVAQGSWTWSISNNGTGDTPNNLPYAGCGQNYVISASAALKTCNQTYTINIENTTCPVTVTATGTEGLSGSGNLEVYEGTYEGGTRRINLQDNTSDSYTFPAGTSTITVRFYFNGKGSKTRTFTVTLNQECCACPAPTGVTVSDITDNSAQVSWTGDAAASSYNIRWWPQVDYATVTLTAGDVWGNGTGYQMLLDADANTYGTTIPTTGGLTTSGDASAATYAEFEYKIPTNADGALTTSNIVFNNSITIQVPAGTYDWCITNPAEGDRMWIASSDGTIAGRADDYVFEAGYNYEFVVSFNTSTTGDRVDLTVSQIIPDIYNHAEGIASSPYTITGLDPLVTYVVQVQADCGGDGESNWITETFTTLPPTPTITQTDNPLPECGDGNATLVASVPSVPTGYVYHWYSNSTCTTEITTGISGTNNNTLSYPATNAGQVWCRLEKIGTIGETTFSYTGSVQTYNVPTGATSLTLEVWGAQGGIYNIGGGKGGYSVGTLSLENLNTFSELYVYVGGQGGGTSSAGGWNGGGKSNSYGSAGGGGTDIATHNSNWNTTDHYYSRIIVAGGGGGEGYSSTVGGDGGGLSGDNGGNGTATGGEGASQTTGGTNNAAGSFGTANTTHSNNGGGGGGGWYGGSSGTSGNTDSGGGGGSGYVYTATSATNYPTGCLLNSNYYLTDASTTAGQRTGNGQAKITAIGTLSGPAGTVTIQCCNLDANIQFGN